MVIGRCISYYSAEGLLECSACSDDFVSSSSPAPNLCLDCANKECYDCRQLTLKHPGATYHETCDACLSASDAQEVVQRLIDTVQQAVGSLIAIGANQ